MRSEARRLFLGRCLPRPPHRPLRGPPSGRAGGGRCGRMAARPLRKPTRMLHYPAKPLLRTARSSSMRETASRWLLPTWQVDSKKGLCVWNECNTEHDGWRNDLDRRDSAHAPLGTSGWQRQPAAADSLHSGCGGDEWSDQLAPVALRDVICLSFAVSPSTARCRSLHAGAAGADACRQGGNRQAGSEQQSKRYNSLLLVDSQQDPTAQGRPAR